MTFVIFDYSSLSGQFRLGPLFCISRRGSTWTEVGICAAWWSALLSLADVSTAEKVASDPRCETSEIFHPSCDGRIERNPLTSVRDEGLKLLLHGLYDRVGQSTKV
jgi:hypothetical protein